MSGLGFFELTAAVAAGVVLAGLYLWSLTRTATAEAEGRRPLVGVRMARVLRYAGTAAAMYGILGVGGWPALLAAATGFTSTRFIAPCPVRSRNTGG